LSSAFTPAKERINLVPINFHAQEYRYSYAGREADKSWREAITSIVDPVGEHIADIGCGGGIYTLVWSKLGASQVIGIDSSEQMVQAASESTAAISNITIRQGSATATGLDDEQVNIVFERALIHHLTDLTPCFQEAKRILRPGGTYIIQDRTLDDVQLPGSSEHLRGYIFERFPHLLEIEEQRRPRAQRVETALHSMGFTSMQVHTLWETRKTYANQNELADELSARTGRSILHELTDSDLADLISYIQSKLPTHQPIIEKDRWTIWHTTKSR
jgi:ubiquinone/menaquinone biosynthesis C-methylase UbiE